MLAAVYSLPAAAAFFPTPGNFFHHPTTHAAKPQWTILSIRNASSEARELRIGHESFKVPAHGTTKLSVTVGASVHVTSTVNSHVDSRFEAQASTNGPREIVLN